MKAGPKVAVDGAWTADVQYRLPDEHSSRLGKFPAEDVREDHTDRSHGRH